MEGRRGVRGISPPSQPGRSSPVAHCLARLRFSIDIKQAGGTHGIKLFGNGAAREKECQVLCVTNRLES